MSVSIADIAFHDLIVHGVMADLTQLASSTRDSVGRYFSVVSAIPSGVLVAWLVLLVGSGAWSGPPDPQAALRVFVDVGVAGGIGLVLAALFLGVVMHPMQYAFVQFLEGYWGDGLVGRRFRTLRSGAHFRRIRALRGRSGELTTQINLKRVELAAASAPRKRAIADEIARLRSDRGELERLTLDYPMEPEAFMPTRLGNVLRHYEWAVGRGYGIEPVWVTPYVMSVAAATDVEYLDDQRSQLDLAARMTIVSFMATALTVLFLARHGLWLLIAIVPYVSGYVSYRGSVVAAAEYGRALGVVITLNRFALYERLQLMRPADVAAERVQNEDLMYFLRHGETDGLNIVYRIPPPPA